MKKDGACRRPERVDEIEFAGGKEKESALIGRSPIDPQNTRHDSAAARKYHAIQLISTLIFHSEICYRSAGPE
jgi:hypothetical protein